MSVYILERTQVIPRPLEAVFPFFADAQNLESITPPWLHFRILTPLPIKMTEGARIEYRIRWRGVPWHWLTEITAWEPPHRFVDEQLRGPYSLWRHEHIFQQVGGETHMTDRVQYALRWGPVGKLAHALVVRRDLESIFDYRRAVVSQAFGRQAADRLNA